MNDEEFRKKCREFSYQQMEDYFKDYQERDAFKSKEGIAIALLYIASNMPSIEENGFPNREQQGCAFCNSGKDKQQLIDNRFVKICLNSKIKAITLENEKQFSDSSEVVSSVVGSFPIAYCPVCRRKL